MRAHGAAEPQELEDHIRLCFVLSCGELDHLVDERRRHESLREVLRLLPVDVLELCNLCRAANGGDQFAAALWHTAYTARTSRLKPATAVRDRI